MGSNVSLYSHFDDPKVLFYRCPLTPDLPPECHEDDGGDGEGQLDPEPVPQGVRHPRQ